MSKTPNKPSFLRTPVGLVALAVLAWVLALVLATLGASAIASSGIRSVWLGHLILLPSYAAGLAAIILFAVGVIRWAVFGPASVGVAQQSRDDAEMVGLLRSINDRLLISDTAKRIAYREQDRETLRKAIREDIAKGDYEAALALVTEMSQAYGYRREAEAFRDEILAARDKDIDNQVDQAIAGLDAICATGRWEQAMREAAKIQRLFPDSPRVRNLEKRVRDAREQRKHDLERQFLAAAAKDDVEGAIELLKELDQYLTPAEAEPFRETARGVIGKKRQNLGVQFKMAVHDREWTQAVVVGEQIIREFPNTKMADEVRSMLDLLRERAAGEQAARPREMA